ncbi:MAG: thioredoxin family protein [Gemmataceae bacterium]|nr:thioredoxin family protein [Gemmataceae bacterium]
MGGEYVEPGPARAEVDATRGPLAVEFGENWCGYCRAARPHVEAALAEYPDVPHVKVADGPGRPLGRSYRVKLWPTLVVLMDGREVGRVVRPESADEVQRALERIRAQPNPGSPG